MPIDLKQFEGHTPEGWRWCDTSFFGDPLTGPNKDCLIGPDKDPNRQPYPSDSADHILYLDSPIAEHEPNARLLLAAPLLLRELAQARAFIYECILELSYVQEAEDISQCASAKGKSLVNAGMKLLGVKDLSAETLAGAEMGAGGTEGGK